MKIFGYELFGKKPPVVQDEVPEIKVPIPDTKKPALIKPVKDPVLRYRTTRSVGRGAFNPSEYDLAEIGRIEDTDSYVRQAFDKKVALMFKEGWTLTGANPRTIKYIKARLAQIARASKMPTELLLRQVGSSLIRKSNAFIIKVRNTEASGGRLREEPGKTASIQPVAGYFVAPAEAMYYELTGDKITKWRQKMPNGDYKDFNPRDVIHLYYDRKDGFVSGTPVLTPVADDIRALRKIEENIEMLVYQHLFPLFHYKVGTPEAPAGVTEKGEREVDVVRREIEYMPSEGGIVTPERHEIKVIGAEGRAIRAEGYLEHFKKRVFAGLGVSAVDMGEGETANRATADNMSRNLIDSVKEFQQIFQAFINFEVLDELLLESTFGPEVLDEENKVILKFKEIDVDAQIKKENHYADLFEKDSVTHDELRRNIGYEPLRIPTREEMDSEADTAELYPEWHRMRWKMFKEPELLIQALDEPWSPTAKAVARASSLETTQSDIDEAGQEKQDQEIALEKERTKAKVAVAKARPRVGNTRPSKPKKVRNGYLQSAYSQVTKDVVNQVTLEQKLDHDWVGALIRTQMSTTIDRLIADQMLAFRNGYSAIVPAIDLRFMGDAGTARSKFRTRAERYITRLTEHVLSALKRRVHEGVSAQDVAIETRAVFESFEYRTRFIEDVEVRKAYSWGKVLAWSRLGVEEVYSVSDSKEQCNDCRNHNSQSLSLNLSALDDVPPYHASCSCKLTQFKATAPAHDASQQPVVPGEGSAIVKKQSGPVDKPLPQHGLDKDLATCPECGKTAIRKKDTPDIYNCRACKHSFRVLAGSVEEQEDQSGPKEKRAQFTKCVQKAKARLRSQHPDWDENKVEMMAEAACDHLLQDSEEDNVELTDGEKMDRCVSRVKAQLRKKNPNWSDDHVTSSAFAICNTSLKGK